MGVGGVRHIFFLRMEIRLVKICLSCGKTFVVRRTRDHSTPKLTKICLKSVENCQKASFGSLLGVRPKKFLYKTSQLINRNIFLDKSFSLKSKIKNFEKMWHPITLKFVKVPEKRKNWEKKLDTVDFDFRIV